MRGETDSEAHLYGRVIMRAYRTTSGMAIGRLWRWSPSRKRRASHLLRLDVRRRVAITNDDEIALSAREFALLDYLMQHEDEICSANDLIEAVWGTRVPAPGLADAYVDRLRGKLGTEAIEIVPGAGYRYPSAA